MTHNFEVGNQYLICQTPPPPKTMSTLDESTSTLCWGWGRGGGGQKDHTCMLAKVQSVPRLLTRIIVVQSSKKVPSSCPEHVKSPSGQVTFHSHKPDEQRIRQVISCQINHCNSKLAQGKETLRVTCPEGKLEFIFFCPVVTVQGQLSSLHKKRKENCGSI